MSASRFKDSPLGLVPKDWTVETVGECFDLLRNNTFSRAMLDEQPGEVYDVHYGDVLVKYDTIIDCRRDRLPSLRKEVSVGKSVDYAQEGDLIFADTAEDDTVGKAVELVNVDDLKIVSGLHTIFMRPKMHRFASKWLGYFVNSNAFHSQLLPFVAGSKVSSISRGNIKRAYVLIPTENEQRRIAEILSTCDEVITRSRAAVEKLRRIKAGMINDFFTRGIGENGQLRPTPQQDPKLYKDSTLGPIPKEWEVKTVSGFGDVVTGATPPRNDSGNWGGDFSWISAKDFKTKYIDNAIEHITEQGKGYCRLLPENAVLVTCIASIGLNAIARTACATNQQINAVICKDDSFEFLYYQICYREDALRMMAGQTAVPIVGKKEFEKMLLICPSVNEQDRIAERLAAMDERIATEERVIAKYRSVKAGLMQRLLSPPADAEVEENISA